MEKAIGRAAGLAGTLAEDLFATGRLRAVGIAGGTWRETRRLRDLFAGLKNDSESKAMDAGYQKLLDPTIQEATDLDEAVRSGDTAKNRQALRAR